jgi:hypothetical protein
MRMVLGGMIRSRLMAAMHKMGQSVCRILVNACGRLKVGVLVANAGVMAMMTWWLIKRRRARRDASAKG